MEKNIIELKAISKKYNNNIILDNFKEYINNYPKEMGVKPTYISMKYLREELKKERDNLELAIARAEAQLQLIKEIIDKVEKI